MSKVEHYREKLEQQEDEKRRLYFKHNQSLNNVKKFYRNIALAPTRTGRMVKTALCKSHSAKQFVKDIVENASVIYP